MPRAKHPGASVAIVLFAAGCAAAHQGSGGRAPAPPAESRTPSGPDLAPVDVAIDPCTDFARFACGSGDRQLRANDAIAGRRPAIERFMTEIAAGQHADPAHGTPLLREFYRRCTGRDARAAGVGQLRAELDEIGRATTLAALARDLGRLRAHGTRVLIDLTAERPPGPPDSVINAHIGLASPRLPVRFYAPAHPLVAAYRRHWQALARLSGAVNAAEVDAAARVDVWLATNGMTTTATSGPMPHPIAAAELAGARFPWTAYLAALDPPVPGPYVTRSTQTLARVDALAALPLAELKSYVRVTLIERWAEFLDVAFFAEELRFHESVAGSSTAASAAPANLSTSCAALAARDLGPLLADAYFSAINDRAGERAARELFDQLRARLDRRVERADWIDEAARGPARQRLSTLGMVFVENIDAPSATTAASSPEPPGSFLSLYRRKVAGDARTVLSAIGHPSPKEPLTPTLSPGEYFSGANLVWVSPEILRPPYLRTGAFNATSFGALGAVMGHEIAHAVSAEQLAVATAAALETGAARRHPDAARGALSDRLACLKRHLDRVSPPVAAADSRRQLLESWADRVGVDLALEAMDDAAATGGHAAPLDAWRRDFFVAYAQALCAVQGDSASEIDSLRDPHPPARTRINSVVGDSPGFARAFACRVDAPMVPPHACSAW